MPDNTQYSATGSLLGYLYQCRLALLEALKRAHDAEDFSMSLETLDDVVFESGSNSSELLQVKHHVTHKASLTDKSVDLWKTIGIWIDLRERSVTPSDCIRCLLTTAQADSGSAVSLLLQDETRDVDVALTILVNAAKETANKSIREQCDAFLGLEDREQKDLLSSLFIYDCQPSISDLDDELKKAIRFTCSRDQEVNFLSYLEGWWFKRSIKALTDEQHQVILSEELMAELDSLRESFKAENLPIASELLTAEKDISNYDGFRFIQQLELIDIKNPRRIALAANNYYRAFTQRSRWLREDLLIQGDLDTYDKQLHEEWEIRFEEMRDRLGDEETETQKTSLAKDLYRWAEQDADIPIRRDCTHSFIVRGSYHMLADRENDLMVGWHPNFRERLKSCLELEEQEAEK